MDLTEVTPDIDTELSRLIEVGTYNSWIKKDGVLLSVVDNLHKLQAKLSFSKQSDVKLEIARLDRLGHVAEEAYKGAEWITPIYLSVLYYQREKKSIQKSGEGKVSRVVRKEHLKEMFDKYKKKSYADLKAIHVDLKSDLIKAKGDIFRLIDEAVSYASKMPVDQKRLLLDLLDWCSGSFREVYSKNMYLLQPDILSLPLSENQTLELNAHRIYASKLHQYVWMTSDILKAWRLNDDITFSDTWVSLGSKDAGGVGAPRKLTKDEVRPLVEECLRDKSSKKFYGSEGEPVIRQIVLFICNKTNFEERVSSKTIERRVREIIPEIQANKTK